MDISLNVWKTLSVYFFFFGGLLVSLSAQPVFQWDRTYGGTDYEELHEIKPLSDGSIIYAGATRSRKSGSVSVEPCDTSSIQFDFWLLKTDIRGNKLWDKRFGGSGLDRMWSVIPTTDGGFLLGGDSDSPAGCGKSEDNIDGSQDMWIIKVDEFGNQEWDKTYGTSGKDELQNLAQLPDGSFFVMGFTYSGANGGNLNSPAIGGHDIRLLKIDAAGDLIWDKVFGGSGHEQGYELTKTGQGDYLIGGFSTSSSRGETGMGNKTAPLYGQNDFWVVKINADGEIIWDASYGGDGEESLQSIEQSQDGGFFLIGQSASPQFTGTKTAEHRGLRDFYLIKTDNDGNILWEKTYGGSDYDDGFALYENEEGELLLGGVSRSDSKDKDSNSNKTDDAEGGNDYWMLFLEPNGDIVWDVSFGGARDDALTSIFPVIDGGVMLGGHSSSNASGDKTHDNVGDNERNDIWIIKTACKLTLDLGSDTTICEGEKIFLDASQDNCFDCRYRWTDGLRASARSVQPEVSKKYGLRISSRSGCEVSDTVTIQVNDAPETFFANITPPKCPGENTGSIQITHIEGGTEPYYYSFNGGAWNEARHFFGLKPDDYLITLMDANECITDTLIEFERPDEIDILITGYGNIELGDSNQLVPVFNESIDSFRWGENPFLSCWDCLTPFAKPLETTTFSLKVFNNNGCKFTESVVVTVRKERPVFFPTAFSPNNDGTNDTYQYFLGSGIKKVHNFKIYGRWGEILFSQRNYHPGEYLEGWDGRHKDKYMPPGTYIYFADIEWIDGWKERIEGSFNLVR